MNFDFVSDIHIDSWVSNKTQSKINSFVNRLVPDEPNKTLIIAGDIGHSNTDIEKCIISFKRFYSNIIVVFGNHDHWIINRKTSNYSDSFDRTNNMKERLSKLENVFVLDGNIVTIDGVTYGGCTGWYDGEYGRVVLNVDETEIEKCHETFCDFHYVINDYKGYNQLCKIDKEKLNNIIDICDVIVTHHIPNWSNVYYKYKNDLFSSFFYFDGRELLDRCKDKVWVYGHTHEQQHNVVQGCTLICNPIGYKGELFDNSDYYEKKFPRMVRSFQQ